MKGLVFLFIAWSMAACGSFGNSGSSSSCFVSLTSDSGSGDILDSSHIAAQSFEVLSGTKTISSISVKLIVNSTNHTTLANGNIQVSINPDSAVTSPISPTTPNTTPYDNGGSSTTNFCTISASSVSLTTAGWYSCTLPTAVNLSSAAWWVYVNSQVGVSATVQVLWEKSSSNIFSQGFPYYNGSAGSGFDFLMQIGC